MVVISVFAIIVVAVFVKWRLQVRQDGAADILKLVIGVHVVISTCACINLSQPLISCVLTIERIQRRIYVYTYIYICIYIYIHTYTYTHTHTRTHTHTHHI